RFVITAPLNKPMLPAPVQRTVPPFSKVRLVMVTTLGMAALSVAPTAITVRPLPLMDPAVQFITVLAVTVLVPPSVLLIKFNTAGDTNPVPLKLAVSLGTPEMVSVLFVQM